VSPHRNSRLAVILFVTAPIILWENAAMAMTLNSPAFQQNGHIPSKYTCEGEDVSPLLAWEGVPNGAKSLALIIDDPDAPDPKAPKMVWVHWVVYNMPADSKSLPENVGKAPLPQGALLGVNDFKKTGYGGPSERPQIDRIDGPARPPRWRRRSLARTALACLAWRSFQAVISRSASSSTCELVARWFAGSFSAASRR